MRNMDEVFGFIDAHPEQSEKFLRMLREVVVLAGKHLDGLTASVGPLARAYFEGLPEEVRAKVTEDVRKETMEVTALIALGAVYHAVVRSVGPTGVMLAMAAARLGMQIDISFGSDGGTSGPGVARA